MAIDWGAMGTNIGNSIPNTQKTNMAIDWGSVIGAVVNTAPQIVQAATKQPVAPYPSTGGILPTITQGLGVQNAADQVLKKSIGASLKQYWWVIAIPCVLLLAIILKPLFTKKKW